VTYNEDDYEDVEFVVQLQLKKGAPLMDVADKLVDYLCAADDDDLGEMDEWIFAVTGVEPPPQAYVQPTRIQDGGSVSHLPDRTSPGDTTVEGS